MINREYLHDTAFRGDDRPSNLPAPGKRTLTQGLPASTLRGKQRAVADFDAGAGDGIADTRDTIEAPAASGPDLSDRQLARARRRNPHWIRTLRLAPHVVSNAPVDSAGFAFDVAGKQATAGLPVDGIAGPRTVRALFPAPSAKAAVADDGVTDTRAIIDGPGGEDADEQVAAADPFARDDPFGMHLIE